MALNVYVIAGMQSGSTVLRDIRSKNINPNITEMLLGGSGGLYNTVSAIGQINPIIDFVSGDIKRILALMTVGPQLALAIAENFYLWFQKCTDGGVRTAGSTHTKGTIAKGMVIPVSLTLTDDDTKGAELSCQVLLISADGSTTPLSLAGSQALVAAAGAAEAWTLGAVSINGTVLEGVKSVTINFGITPATLGSSGMVYKTFSCVMKVQPTITIEANSIDEFISWGFTGASQGATDSTILIQDCTDGGVRGSAPITCSIDKGIWKPGSVAGSDGQPMSHNITCSPIFDGTALPLAWTGLT